MLTKILRLSIILLLNLFFFKFVFFSNKSLATVSFQTSENKTKRVPSKIIKREGWQISGLTSIKAISNSKLTLIDGDEVLLKSFTFNEKQIVDLDSYVIVNGSDIQIFKMDYLVNGLMVYEVNGKPFAYFTILTAVATADHNIIQYYGGRVYYVYYDNDGDGIFETLSTDTDIKIPSWAKKVGNDK